VLQRGREVRRHTAGPREWDHRVILSWEAERERPGFSEEGLRRVGEFARIRDDRPAVAAAV